MNDLAIQAKTDNYALEKILFAMRPLCRSLANRYATRGMEYDDIYNYAQAEVWHAVKKFEPGMKSFRSYCRMIVINHIKSRVKRAYGKTKQLDREAARLDKDFNFGDDQIDSLHEIIPSPFELEAAVVRREIVSSILPIIRSENLSQLEYDSVRMFWFDERDYRDIADELGVSRKSIDNALTRAKRKLRKNEQLQQIYAEMA